MLILLCVGGRAEAKKVEHNVILGWSVDGYVTDQGVRCNASTYVRDDQVFGIGIDQDYNVDFSVSLAGWSLRKGETYQVAYSIDDTQEVLTSGEGGGPVTVFVDLTKDELERFLNGSSVTVRAPSAEFNVPLRGSVKAVGAALDCVKRLSGDK